MKTQNRYEIFTTYAFNQFITIFLLMFFSIMVWTFLKPARDIITLGLNPQDPMILPSLEFWAGLPLMALFTCVFIVLSNHFPREKLFYICAGIILIPLFAGIMWLFPIKEKIYPAAEEIQRLREAYPHVQAIFIFYGKWLDVLMYLLISLWFPVFVAMFPWQFANDLTNLLKARFFYPVLTFFLGIPQFLGSYLVKLWGKAPQDEVYDRLRLYVMIAVGFCFLMVLVYRRYHTLHEKNSAYLPEQKPLRYPLIPSFNHMFSDPSSRGMFFLTVGISFILTILASILLEQVGLMHTHKEAVANLHQSINGWIGSTGKIVVMYTVVALVALRFHRWKGLGFFVGVSVLSIVLLVYTLTYTSYIVKDEQFFGVPVGILCVVFAISFLESIRQYWFVPLKEMLFISLAPEHRVKSKAICDLLGVAAGNACAHLMISMNKSLAGGDFFQALPYNIGFAMIFSVVWFKAITDLGPHMGKAEASASQRGE